MLQTHHPTLEIYCQVNGIFLGNSQVKTASSPESSTLKIERIYPPTNRTLLYPGKYIYVCTSTAYGN